MATDRLRFIDGQSGYRDIVRHVAENGEKRSPRGLVTSDVGYTTIELLSPYNALPLGVGRQLSKRVAAAEAIQLIGGFADPQLLLDASPNFQRYIEPTGEFWGAYGRRIRKQLAAVCAKLHTDPDTRQAIITLWDPRFDNQRDKRDYPCTLALGFSIRHERVELDVTMRSNDVWRGLPYDIFQFTQLQLTVANVLHRQPGAYRHHTYSLHLYGTDADVAYDVLYADTPIIRATQPLGFGSSSEVTVHGAMKRAKRVAREVTRDQCIDDSERWYWDALHPAK